MSRELAYLLRHDKTYPFEIEGWREVEDLVKNHGYTVDKLKKIVREDKKGRYEIEGDIRIRALQGHSIPGIYPGLTLSTPPDVLYHGTSSRFMKSIMNEGLKKMSRNHVHLSKDQETAKIVGSRHGGDLVILEIDCSRMVQDGYKFWISRN